MRWQLFSVVGGGFLFAWTLMVVAHPPQLESPPSEDDSPVAWEVSCLDSRFRSEGVAVADVNRDGKLDVLAGEVWYEAPDWTMHELSPVGDYGDGANGYSQSFLCFADDVNGDGWVDQIVIGFPGAPCHWFENPRGESGHWKRHFIWESACNESPLYVDLFGNGKRVLVMGTQPAGQENMGQMAWFQPGEDPTAPWTLHPISHPSTATQAVTGTHRYAHGLGIGDVNSDGRQDVLCTGGWWEQPETDHGGPWQFHPANLGDACSQMYVLDVNGDGVPDVVSSSAHSFGIWWHEQQVGESGERTFVKHDLFPDLVSQTHALEYQDIDGDGLQDLITGKRWWAHGPTGDPGSDQPAHVYWFQASKTSEGVLQFTPRLIHDNSGVGLHVEVADIDQDGLLDIVLSNKKGVHVMRQIRR